MLTLMVAPLVVLPLAAVLINDVKTAARDGEITVEVATSDPVATSDIRVASGGPHRFFVYLDGSAAKQMRFGEGAGAVVVHPRQRYTKLEIPTDGRCGEPIGVVRTADGVRVRASCQAASASKSTLAPPIAVQAPVHVERPLPDAPQAALGKDKNDKQAQAALRAALALPEEAGVVQVKPARAAASAPAAEGVQPEAKVPAPERAKDPSPAKEEPAQQAKAPVAAAPKIDAPEAPAAAVVQPESARTSSAGGDGKSGGGVITTVAGVALLLGLGVVGVLFARKRVSRQRMIRIVETASIGPRRSLVVACVGGRTMVLGVSEAGVSLLDAPATAPAAPGLAAPSPSPSVEDAAFGLRNLSLATPPSIEERPAEVKHESSLLSRLFQRKPREGEGLAREDFEHLFAESLEDEELRRKLALGQSGRIA